MLRIFILPLYLLLSSQVVAETTDKSFENYIDEKQKSISNKVINLFDGVDESINNFFGGSEDNYINDKDIGYENSIDKFFKNEKYIDETQRSFIRIRFGSLLQSKTSTIYNYKISARIPLSRTKRSFQLFIDDIEKNYVNYTTYDDETHNTPQVGIYYFAPKYHDIRSKYSIGVRGFSAFIRARYSKIFKVGKWDIEPTQQFKYSTKYDFEEESNIYFDRQLDNSSLFRTSLHRRTKSKQTGMDYRVAFTYYNTPQEKSGFSVTQYFWGNTKYTTLDKPKTFSGISDYITTFSWRQNIWRDWIAYEIQPGVSFHRQYDYKENYMLRFNLDFYFGSI
ncbi:MAG: hypothetical protein L3J10_03570 [Sulfurimonas sp.]|nr:hypothetical protein [Sulfurimonas sp.]